MQDVVGIEVTPLSTACGAEVKGIDLTRPLSATTIQAIKFGELADRKKAPEQLRGRDEGSQQDNQKILLVSNVKVDGKAIGAFGEGEFWFHIDGGYTPRPYRYTFLYAIEVPSTGGNTMFSNMYKAYEAVPAVLKEKLRGRKALHIHEYNRAKQANSLGDISGIPHHFHPVFITHPDTGGKTLFVDRLMTTRIDGLSAEDSSAILDQLYEIGDGSCVAARSRVNCCMNEAISASSAPGFTRSENVPRYVHPLLTCCATQGLSSATPIDLKSATLRHATVRP